MDALHSRLMSMLPAESRTFSSWLGRRTNLKLLRRFRLGLRPTELLQGQARPQMAEWHVSSQLRHEGCQTPPAT